MVGGYGPDEFRQKAPPGVAIAGQLGLLRGGVWVDAGWVAGATGAGDGWCGPVHCQNSMTADAVRSELPTTTAALRRRLTW